MIGKTLLAELPRSLAIRTAYRHHGEKSGYRQILEHTRPNMVVGANERRGRSNILPYKWLYEWQAWLMAFSADIDIVHILYGEEYFRFADRLFPNIPIIATFHQPVNILEREITKGDSMGRSYAVMHRLNPNRFSRLAAAIVLGNSQREVLSKVMAWDKIHVIPLGCDSEGLIAQTRDVPRPTRYETILTVGNWLRDWDFYFSFVEYCHHTHPAWKFELINRNLNEKCRARANLCPNLIYKPSVSDQQLLRSYVGAAVQFLPLIEATGNNSLNESLACGCPVVSNQPVCLGDAKYYSRLVDLDEEAVANAIEPWVGQVHAERADAIDAAQNAVRELDWSMIAKQTISVYGKAIQGN